jgi:hypothetical protein
MLLIFLMPLVFASLHLAYGVGSVWGCARLAMMLVKPKPERIPEVVR